MKINRELIIKFGSFAIVCPSLLLIIFLGDRILLNFLNRNKNIVRSEQQRFFDYPIEKINDKNIGKYISEGSLLTEASKRLSHHDSVLNDFKLIGDGKEIIWIFGDSWLEGIRKENINNNIIGTELDEDYKLIRLIGTTSYSPLLMHLAYKDRILRYKETPDNVVIFIDQTDIGDDYCRYRPSVLRDKKGKLIGVLDNYLGVSGIYRSWSFHLTMREHKSGILLAIQRFIHALHLRLIPSIEVLTNCTEKELIAWQMGLNSSPSGVIIKNYEKYFLNSMNEFLETIYNDSKRKKILLVTHDWARHSLPKENKDHLSKNISTLVEKISRANNINHLHVKTGDYKNKNISDIYQYPSDRFSHLRDYTYLSKRIGESLKNIILKGKL